MNILISCDDGSEAPGFAALAAEVSRLGTVRASSTERPASGVGHAVTLHQPVGAWPTQLAGTEQAMVVRGTPADSVKLALTHLWPGWADIVFTGINQGPNVGVNIFYSGTAGAAAEAAVSRMSAVAVSLDISAPYDFPAAAERARPVLERLASLAPFPKGMFFNVNLPCSQKPVRGIRLTRQGLSGFREYYRPCQCTGVVAPHGACFYRVDGDMIIDDPDDITDATALAAGYISVTPLYLDLTVEPFRRRVPEQAGLIAETISRLADWQ